MTWRPTAASAIFALTSWAGATQNWWFDHFQGLCGRSETTTHIVFERTQDLLAFISFSMSKQCCMFCPGRLVTICGTVTRTTDIKPELLVATWKCNECQREISGVAQEFKVTTPARCPTKNCGNTTNWKLLAESRSTRWGDWQRVRLQENENEVPAGSMPQTMDVIVRDEGTERCKAGDKVQITGSLIVVPDVPTLMSPGELKATVRRSLNTRSDPILCSWRRSSWFEVGGKSRSHLQVGFLWNIH